MNHPLRVGSVVANSLMQVGIQTLIQNAGDLALVFATGRYGGVPELCQQHKPDILLLSLQAEELLSLVRLCDQNYPIPMLTIAEVFDENAFYTLLKTGVRGYFYTADDAELLVNAIRTVAKGDHWCSPSLAIHLFQPTKMRSSLPPLENGAEPLTTREVHILQMVAQGWSNQKIGDALGVTERTVRSHVRNIYDKLHLSNRSEAIVWTLRSGLSEASFTDARR